MSRVFNLAKGPAQNLIVSMGNYRIGFVIWPDNSCENLCNRGRVDDTSDKCDILIMTTHYFGRIMVMFMTR